MSFFIIILCAPSPPKWYYLFHLSISKCVCLAAFLGGERTPITGCCLPYGPHQPASHLVGVPLKWGDFKDLPVPNRLCVVQCMVCCNMQCIVTLIVYSNKYGWSTPGWFALSKDIELPKFLQIRALANCPNKGEKYHCNNYNIGIQYVQAKIWKCQTFCRSKFYFHLCKLIIDLEAMIYAALQ